ncbi:flagellar biosynthetic protein FliO [Naasia sp. SYSU D00948]|uniref:flagellar biosynthetic protein FliO n=1 Tax=Naasia sp. SYSU D00948 TaxID=2817379 RepID=UPI001B317BC2|nr:flagellar biosynthetic protein FliO [Naasia sp. SYSU D00948]
MDTLFLALRVAVSLGAVLAVIWLARRWLSGGANGRARTRHVIVLAKQAVGAKASVAVVETDGRRYLLGVTDHTITVLDRLETEPAEVTTTPIPLPTFERALEDARSAPPPAVVRAPIQLPVTRRSVREAEEARAKTSTVAGSILSPDTWRQTAMALRRAR